MAKTATFVSATPFPVLLVCVWMAVILQNGVWVRPNIDSLRVMASDPYHNLLGDIPARQYLYTSYLGVWLAHYLHAYHSLWAFAGLHLLEVVLGLSLVFIVLRKEAGEEAARVALVVFLLLPQSNVLVTWLGIGDPLVMMLASLLILVRAPAWTLLGSFLLGLAHTEQAAVIALMLIAGALLRVGCLTEATPGRTALRTGAMVAGVGLAHLLLQTLFAVNRFNLQETRFSFFFSRGAGEFLWKFFRDPTVTFYSLYQVAWIPLVALFGYWWTRNRAHALWLLVANAIALGIAMLVFDVTRVFSLLAWPIVVVALLECGRSGTFAQDAARVYRWAAVGLLLSFVVPKIIMWDGLIHTGTRMHTVMLALGKIDPTKDGWAMRPFR